MIVCAVVGCEAEALDWTYVVSVDDLDVEVSLCADHERAWFPMRSTYDRERLTLLDGGRE